MKVSAGWNLLNGPGSLPQEVWYLGEWGETNAIYSVIDTNLVGGTLIPTGFKFQQFQVGPFNEISFAHDIVVVKRVDVEVTMFRPGCSRATLIPSPNGQAVIIDRRFDSGIPNRPPSYQNPFNGQWPTLEKSKELANHQQGVDLKNLAIEKKLATKSQGKRQSSLFKLISPKRTENGPRKAAYFVIQIFLSTVPSRFARTQAAASGWQAKGIPPTIFSTHLPKLFFKVSFPGNENLKN